MDIIDMLRLHIVSPSGYRRIVNFYIRCTGCRMMLMVDWFLIDLLTDQSDLGSMTRHEPQEKAKKSMLLTNPNMVLLL